MKLPKGFGKNYFTLSAITATSNQVTINAQITRVHNFHMLNFESEELEAELEEEELEILSPSQLSTKPCHCSYYFLNYTRKTLKLHFIPNLFINYFHTLNNSISPPLLTSFLKAIFKSIKSNNRKYII